MTKIKKKNDELVGNAAPNKISDIAAHYLGLVGGATGTYYEFAQYTQNSGDVGGPATGGGAFWQQVIRQRPMLARTDSLSTAE